MAKKHRHNQGGGNQPRQKMFDESREELFLYDARQVLEDAPVDEDHYKTFLQQIVTRGSRDGVDDAKEYVKEKEREEEAFLDREARNGLLDLLDKYSTYR
ncbi:hypothetical protein BRD56_09715 [Thermoplasmatales archaeon SW_10_69_26]|jgi:hypothetical protein|nr:MAG: hypothetical protein BRD56_09715 [Thermoplasmatales archaeon SW_10_69_26]